MTDSSSPWCRVHRTCSFRETGRARQGSALLLLLLLVCALMVSPQALAAVRITEFLTENDGGLRDADGESPDWIELYNDGAAPANLAGWHLTDTPANLVKWTFPATNLAGGARLVVFASGKNRTVAGAELHTNFQLTRDNGYLALVAPDGTNIAQEVAYPNQRFNVSFGIASETVTTTLLSTGAAARVFVPSNGALGLAWTAAVFDDTGWLGMNTPVSFATGILTNTVLALDFNERAQDAAATTQAGFQSFVINSNITTGTIQTQATTRVYSGVTVTVSNTSPYGVDDRLRTTPANTGAFTESLLLRDFIFSSDAAGTGGLDVSISGLTPNRAHRLTIWSFDSGSPGARLSDWSANGMLMTNNYTFDGGTLPSSNDRYRFSFDATTDGGGVFLVSGRRDSANTSFGVFLNALQIAAITYVAPTSGLASLMFSNNATAYVRVPFVVADPAVFSSLTLRVRYNDGFVAYLNGQPVASRNAPGSPTWNSTATAPHGTTMAEDIAFVPEPGLLVGGTNVLAFHGLNLSAADGEFVLAPELLGQQTTVLGARYFQPATPGTDNGSGYTNLVADTKFSVNRGFYDAPFFLAITSATVNAEIRFTTNGSPPAPTNGFLYTAPITIDRLSLIRAAAFKAGCVPSDIDTHTYVFLRDVFRQSNSLPNYPTSWQGSYPADYAVDPNVVNHLVYGPPLSNDLRAIPTLSLVTEHDGLWGPSRGIYNHATSTHDLEAGQDWERAASAELILPTGSNGMTAFAVNCGLRMQGNASRDNARTPKHSFRLLFTSQYGPSKLRYPWFPDPVDQFDNIVLRAVGFVDAWPSRYSDTTLYTNATTGEVYRGARYRPETGTVLRDVFVKDSHRDLGWTASHSDWVHLYVNGIYWGIYNPSERIDSSYMTEHFGGLESDWDVLVGDDALFNAAVADGSKNDWNALINLVNGGIASETTYQSVAALVDLDNLIDYFLLHIFVEAEDWPNHNWYAAHRRANSTNGVPATKWQFFTWDQEVSLDRNVRRDRTGVNNADTPANIYAQLRAWPEFRRQFGDRVHRHLFNGGALTPSNNVARFAARAAAITNAINGEAARWGDAREFTIGSNPGTGQTFTRNEWWVPELQKLWTNFFPRLTADNVARLRAASLYPALNAPNMSPFGGAVTAGIGVTLTQSNVAGTIYFTTDGTDPRVYGTGATAPGAQIYTTPIPIFAPTLLRARVLNGGSWSALVEAQFYPDQDFSKLLLSEIHYNPPMSGGVDGDFFEFVEFHNVGTQALRLDGLAFTAGIDYTFSNNVTLAPGTFLVLAGATSNFMVRFPGVPVHGQFSGKLDNGGESLELSHPLGGVIFRLRYDDNAPWPTAADGFGPSLQRINSLPAYTNAANWTATAPTPGSDVPANLVDSDADGMPDVWEEANGTDRLVADAGADPDGDGVANYNEYRSGTDPLDPVSRLGFTKIELEPEHVRLEFLATSNRTYSVQRSDSPTGPAWAEFWSLPAAPTNRVVVLHDLLSAPAGRFYRVETPRTIPGD